MISIESLKFSANFTHTGQHRLIQIKIDHIGSCYTVCCVKCSSSMHASNVKVPTKPVYVTSGFACFSKVWGRNEHKPSVYAWTIPIAFKFVSASVILFSVVLSSISETFLRGFQLQCRKKEMKTKRAVTPSRSQNGKESWNVVRYVCHNKTYREFDINILL